MNARENLLSLYRRQGWSFAPVNLNLCPSLRQEYKARAGDTPLEEYFDYPEGFAERAVPAPKLAEQEPVDWLAYYPDGVAEGTRFSCWGVAHEPGSAAAAHMTRMRHPMASLDSLEQLQQYPYPEFDTNSIDHIRDGVAAAHAAGKAAIGHMACTIWETAWYMRDMTKLMMDMVMEDEKAVFHLDRVTDLAVQRAGAFACAGVDILHLGDDVGMQQAIMMSEAMYREWLKPRLARVIAAARAEKPDILIFYHSCGYVEPLIDDLIDAGVDILNPVQPECMEFEEIHVKYGDQLSFNGTLGTQTTMPFGTPHDIRATVHRSLAIAGAKGGLFCCPTHLLEPEVPFDNIEAYVQACKSFCCAVA